MPDIQKVSDLEQHRREKITALRSSGVNPYPHVFKTTAGSAQILASFADCTEHDAPANIVSCAGRIMTMRIMGKASFFHLQDKDGRIQVYVKNDAVGIEQYDFFKKMVDIGDIIGVTGTVFKTKTGEITIRATSLKLLSKSILPLPEKWHGLKDVEARYRHRYVDLIVNRDVQNIFHQRSSIVSSLRNYLEQRGFQEVETPLLQPVPGGAAAKPFSTHHNALDMNLFLRIAPELYLKRLIVGGLEKVFEIGKCFRNEGIDARHNPEFTILEVYQAYADYTDMMELCEELVVNSLLASTGRNTIRYRDMDIVCQKPFKRIELNDAVKNVTGMTLQMLFQGGRLRETAQKFHISFEEQTPDHKIFDRIFDEKILPSLTEPTFVIGYPKVISPLAKARENDPDIVERFELFIGHEEVANAYTELNDPEEQRLRFLDQQKQREHGDLEAALMDDDFVEALSYGMPPTGGLGIGIDRLTMLITGMQSIREVLYFPLLKRKGDTPL